MWEAMRSIWYDLLDPVTQTCNTLFTGCYEAVMNIKVELVDDQSVNAYADAESYAIGIHTGLMRSAGCDDEIAWVLAHEAAHLLLGHAQKKMSNAATGGLLGGIAMGALGIAIHQPGMDTEYIGDMAQGGLESGRLAGYLVYSPEMELEADQFAAYVMQRAGYRTNAALDIIVRLHRGEVPASVRRGENWAGYLDTHPANDYRLAAMRSVIDDIQNGHSRPLRKGESLALGADPRQATCGDEFRRRWPNCSKYRGGGHKLSELFSCGYNIRERHPEFWKLCGAWFHECSEDEQRCLQ